MRNGILLAEDAPEKILQAFGTTTLEDAFLILSQKQGQSEEADNTLHTMITAAAEAKSVANAVEASKEEKETTADDENKQLPKLKVEHLAGQEQYLRRNMSFAEQKPPGFWGKMQFTSQSRMKALFSKNILQLIRQPRYIFYNKILH